MSKTITAFAALALASSALAAVEAPTMGWSSWNAYHVNISEDIICRAADMLVELGLKDAGYTYCNIDDGFFGGRDPVTGKVIPHPKRFPNGMRVVSDYIHSKGLKAGIYSDGGSDTCGSWYDHDELGIGVGFYGHDELDAEYYFKELNYDFIKIDFCGGNPGSNKDHLKLDEKERYTAIRKAIDAVGRPDARINVCRWNYPGTWVREIGSSWRMSRDINDKWKICRQIIEENLYMSGYAAPGAYNDMDMLEVGRKYTAVEDETHFATWCMMSSPLLIGCDMNVLRTKRSETLKLLKNADLIAIDQDTAMPQAHVIRREPHAKGSCYVLERFLEEPYGRKRAYELLNLDDEPHEIAFEMKGEVRQISGTTDAAVPAHGSKVFVVTLAEKPAEPTRYEAETAFATKYQELSTPKNAGTPYAEEVDGASAGAVVRNVGGGKGGDIRFQKVWSEKGGAYTAKLVALGGEAVETREVTLTPGMNEIVFDSPKAYPALDYLEVTPKER